MLLLSFARLSTLLGHRTHRGIRLGRLPLLQSLPSHLWSARTSQRIRQQSPVALAGLLLLPPPRESTAQGRPCDPGSHWPSQSLRQPLAPMKLQTFIREAGLALSCVHGPHELVRPQRADRHTPRGAPISAPFSTKCPAITLSMDRCKERADARTQSRHPRVRTPL